MKDRNENRSGYKKTKVGWIPEEWGCIPGNRLTTMIAKGSSPRWQGFEYSSFGMLFITSENVRDGYLNINQPKYLPFEFHKRLKRTQIKKGDILINLVGASIGRSCLVIRDLGPANVNQAVCVFRVRADISREYVGYHFQAPTTVKRILDMQVDAARPNISLTDLRNLLIPLPPLPEQKRIAEILSTWDEAIDQTRKLIEAKKRRKKALMQQLLTGKKRLPGFSEKWKVHRMSDLIRQIFRPVKFDDKANYQLISVRRRSEGIFFRGNISGHDILTKQLYVARKGDFLISKMQIVHGAAALVTEEFDGMYISGSYISLEVTESKKLDINFLNWLSKIPYFYHLTYISSYGVHIEKMTFNLRLFLKSIIKIPGRIDEQRKIVEVLSVADNEIEILKTKLPALEKQKRGLMQKLLTGEVRVKL